MSKHTEGPYYYQTYGFADEPERGYVVGQVGGPEIAELRVTRGNAATQKANAVFFASADKLLRVARVLESHRRAGADAVSLSMLMPDGDDTLGEAVRDVIAILDG